MTKPLPDVQPVLRRSEASLSDCEFREILAGLRPGWYTTAGLYPRYEVWAENRSKALVSRNAFGFSLRVHVGRDNVEYLSGGHGGARKFLLTEEHVSPKS